MHCPNCGGEFEENEAMGERNMEGYQAHYCPFCDEQLSERFTERRNVERCGHNSMSDQIVHGRAVQICQECGAKYSGGEFIGVKSAWNPALGKY